MNDTMTVTLRPSTAGDVEAIATIWCQGWPDGHLGHVPDELRQHRRLTDFLQLVPARVALTTVATIDSAVVGFVTVHDDEIEQIYVAAPARGSGVATALLEHGERQIATRFGRAWLAVVAGNARARRFYTRHGWHDEAGIDYPAEVTNGTVIVPVRRYEKQVRPEAAS